METSASPECSSGVGSSVSVDDTGLELRGLLRRQHFDWDRLRAIKLSANGVRTLREPTIRSREVTGRGHIEARLVLLLRFAGKWARVTLTDDPPEGFSHVAGRVLREAAKRDLELINDWATPAVGDWWAWFCPGEALPPKWE